MGEGARAGRALLAAAVLALSSCGLEILPDLDPPGDSADASESTPLFKVQNAATLIPEFRGFELYYKFLAEGEAIPSGLATKAQVEGAGFRRVYATGVPVLALPLLPVDPADRNTDFVIEIDFNAVATTPPEAVYLGAIPPSVYPVIVCRPVTDGYGFAKTFRQADLEAGDEDLAGIPWPPTTGQRISCVMYALSYGLKDFTDHLYSTARYLGYMSYRY